MRHTYIILYHSQHDIERDRTLAENVLKLHRYRAQGEPDGTVQPIGTVEEHRTTFDSERGNEPESTYIYEKNRDWTAVEEGWVSRKKKGGGKEEE
jgi:hypothetical protein